MDTCYELIADRVSPEQWEHFIYSLDTGFPGLPAEWALPTELREKLMLRIQWTYYNPDLVEDPGEKRARSWAFLQAFLSEPFRRKFHFLRARFQGAELERWDRDFARFERLLQLHSMTEAQQLDLLGNHDAQNRFGSAQRVRVIKNKGAGLTSDLLGVHVLMDWEQIKARYRFLVKLHHPDLGGDPAFTQQLNLEFERLARAIGKKGAS